MTRRLFLLLAITVAISGCAVNPVTGKQELSLVSEQQELAIGTQQYAPARQSQGGDYSVDQELTSYISSVGQRLAAVSDRKLPYEFKVLNNSVPNAWALPGGKISINRGLLTELKSESELAAVLGHEIVHAAAKHGVRSMSKGMLLQAGVAGATIAAQGTGYAGLAQKGAGIGAQLISQKYGRDAERESDLYGMQYMSRAGYDPQGAVELQRTFVKLSAGRHQDWINGLFASHPPSQERVQNNIELLASLPKGGELGVAAYRAKTAQLIKTKPAYQAFDAGREALAKNNPAAALELAQKAIALEPKEGQFYALLGDIEQKNQHPQASLKHYDKAVQLNPGYFYNYLQRGQLNEQLNHSSQAEADLQQSVKLLPTAEAYNALGNLAKNAGRLEEAKGYYAKVAGNQGEVAQQAYSSLVDLDLKDNPAKYLEVKVGQDSQERIVAQISNPTPRNISSIVLLVQYRDSSGRTQQLRRSLNGTVASGKQQLFDLGMTGKLTAEQIKSLQVGVTRAQIAR